MRVKFQQIHPKATHPVEGNNDTANYCYDCIATSIEEVAPNTYRYGLGFALQIDRDWKPEPVCTSFPEIEGAECVHRYNPTYLDLHHTPLKLGFNIHPRSSVWKTGMMLTNHTGIIDEGYTGEISAVFYHYNTDLPKYEVGDRICQICLTAAFPIQFATALVLDQTTRGAGGYGSTGK